MEGWGAKGKGGGIFEVYRAEEHGCVEYPDPEVALPVVCLLRGLHMEASGIGGLRHGGRGVL